MIDRNEFESLGNYGRHQISKRDYAERQYRAVSAILFYENQERGNLFDEYGKMTEVHHPWPRAHCPLWFVFQRENMRTISPELHYAIHNLPLDKMDETQRAYVEEFAEIRRQLEEENRNYLHQ